MRYSVNFTLSVHSRARGLKDLCLAGRIQQGARIAFRLPGAKNRIARNQQLRASLDDGRDRVVSHSAVHFYFKCRPSSRRMAARWWIFSMEKGINSCPPKPGFTLMIRTWCTMGRISRSTSTRVAGFTTTPGLMP